MLYVIKNEKNGTIFKKSLDNYHLQIFLNFEQIFFKTIYLRSPHFNQSQPVLLCTFVLQLIQHKKKNLLLVVMWNKKWKLRVIVDQFHKRKIGTTYPWRSARGEFLSLCKFKPLPQGPDRLLLLSIYLVLI